MNFPNGFTQRKPSRFSPPKLEPPGGDDCRRKVSISAGILAVTSAFPKLDVYRVEMCLLALAILNEFVWRTQPEATWVLYRFPGMMILTFAFSIAHAPLLMKHVKPDEPPAAD